jgi:transposase
MNPVYGEVAAMDVHKKMLAVVIAIRDAGEGEELREKFGTTVRELQRLKEWLNACGVEEVVMESTAQYWRPVWTELEGVFGLHLAQAQSNRAPHGRKSDFADASRLLRRFYAQELRLSFVPDPEQRTWRDLTHTRWELTRSKVALYNHIEILLERAQIKLSSVISDVLGASGRRILQSLAAGVSDPAALASLADRRLRASTEELQDALGGQLGDEQRFILRIYLQQLRLFDRQLTVLDSQIAQCLKAQRDAIERLCGIPGVSIDAAHQVIAEMGPDAQAFPSAAQAASWVGVCPGRHESAGQSSSQASPFGNRAMRRIITQIAWGAVRTKDSFFQLLFKRCTARLGVQKALWAVAHRIVRLIWKILHEKVHYVERGPNLDPLARERRKRNLLRQLKTLGYAATLSPLPASDPA